MGDLRIKDARRDQRVVAGRVLFCLFAVAALGLLLIGRFAHLQIAQHDFYRAQSDENKIKRRVVPPPRGGIYDRNGRLLTDVRPGYGVALSSETLEGLDEQTALLAELLGLEPSAGPRFATRVRRHRHMDSVPLNVRLNQRMRARIAVALHRLPAVELPVRPVRIYPYGELYAHLIGYVGGISEQELKGLQPLRYRNTLVIGKTGVEQIYEDSLHGRIGYENIETDARGRSLRVLGRVKPSPGRDVELHIDHELQQAAFRAMAARRGALVAIEPATGGVLAAVSMPSFDPNLFTVGMAQDEFAALSGAESRPLFNRMAQGQYSPGSIIKPVYALAGLHSRVVDSTYTVSDPGWFVVPGEKRVYRDWLRGGHGEAVDIRQAVTESCDIYFYQLAMLSGLSGLSAFSGQFGVGRLTGVDLSAESSGLLPDPDWKLVNYGAKWVDGDTVNMGIGQGFLLMTPMQMAVMAATLANRGLRPTPAIVRSVGGQPRAPQLTPIERMPSKQQWDLVIGAMRDVVDSPRGTAHRLRRGLRYPMAAKTGTTQVVSEESEELVFDEETGELALLEPEEEQEEEEEVAESERDHALFIAFAPIEKPRIAVAVVIENAGKGGEVAAPIARRVIDSYLNRPPPKAPRVEAAPIARWLIDSNLNRLPAQSALR